LEAEFQLFACKLPKLKSHENMVSGERLMERYGAMVLWFGTGTVQGYDGQGTGVQCVCGAEVRVVRYNGAGGAMQGYGWYGTRARVVPNPYPKKDNQFREKHNQFWKTDWEKIYLQEFFQNRKCIFYMFLKFCFYSFFPFWKMFFAGRNL